MIGIVVVSTTGIGIVGFYLARMIRTYWRLRAPHVVACPETGRTAAISVDPLEASGVLGRRALEVVSCSQWSKLEDCHRGCLRGFLESLGADDRASLSQWYDGKHCALCDKRFAKVSNVWELPAPLDPDGISHQWADVEDFAAMLLRCKPVCWECQLSEVMTRIGATEAARTSTTIERPSTR